ncbi:MAG: hypothetical protein JW759_07740 [Candidatus Coatesbacteria bacterium]|nr:hypothetical protein [Candidatus Coatesbacteria bacterium]
MLDLIVFLAILLVPPGLLALFCFLIHVGMRRDSYGLVMGSVIGLFLFGAPAAFFGPALLAFFVRRTLTYVFWYAGMGLVWAFLSFQGFRHTNERKGKELLVSSLLWVFLLPQPLELAWKWSTRDAYLAVFGLAALGYIVLGILVKLTRAAQAKEVIRHKRMMSEVDAREKPPWEE